MTEQEIRINQQESASGGCGDLSHRPRPTLGVIADLFCVGSHLLSASNYRMALGWRLGWRFIELAKHHRRFCRRVSQATSLDSAWSDAINL